MKTLFFPRRLCCVLFPALILWGGGGHSAPINLPDVPLGTETRVPPNIFMTVDDSASMLRSFNPDNLSVSPTNRFFAQRANGIDRACWWRWGNLNDNFATAGGDTVVEQITFCTPYDETDVIQLLGGHGNADSGWSNVNQLSSLFHHGHPPLLAPAFNGQAYDPLITYRPPRRSNGTFLPDMNAINTGNWATVQWQDGATWPGRPLFNFRTARYAYTLAQRNILFNRYMAGTDVATRNFFDSHATGAGANLRYSLPPHYFKTSVKWCNALRADGSAQANAGFSNCRDERFGAFLFPYYYAQFGERRGMTDNTTSPAFELVVLDFVNGLINGQASITHFYINEDGDLDTFTRTFAEEATNYANWAAYYKNRLVATKAAASHAFADIDSSAAAPVIPRVGFSSINRLAEGSTLVAANPNRNIAIATLPVASFEGAQRNTFFDRLLGFRFTWGGTPLQVSLYEVGEMFRGAGAGAPITLSCQRNYHILFTDGMWNSSPASITGITDVDRNVPNLPHLQGLSVYGSTLTSGAFWPDPIRDRAGAQRSLADIALYYWMTDLRPTMVNNVHTTNRDPANWQHLNFFGMGYGVSGTLPSRNQADTLQRIVNREPGFDWPPPVADQITAVDDLWHASVNGFGRYISAQSPDEFRAGLRSILAEILNTGGARAGRGFTHPNLTLGGGTSQFTYAPSFASGWNGDVVKMRIDSRGMEHAIPGQGTAAENLQALLTPTPSVPDPWNTRRKIFTMAWSGGKVGSGVATPAPFQASALPPSITQHLGGSPTQQAQVIAYLRGDRSREGDSMGRFRLRGPGPLGDIVNAMPEVVTLPFCDQLSASRLFCSYDDTKNPGYKAFYQAQVALNRKTMVYVAANDGMLHAFDGNLDEQWAYIPSDLFRPHNEGGIINLTFQETNPDTPFKHYYYVDATPRVLDVFLPGRGGWRTVLVGGLGKGGTSYYALDVTDPTVAATEAGTASKMAMWEFTHNNMGYTFGRADLVKTRAKAWGYKSDDDPDGKWVAILPSGYNNGSGNGQPKNGDGKGHLFFVDLETGALLHTLSTPEGSADDPLGLVAIGGYTEFMDNQLALAIYAGDQKGNLWRFNLEDDDFNQWTVEKMATLTDSDGRPQWVTTEPWPLRDANGDRWVFVGTGGFRESNDLASNVRHTFYAFRDGGIDRNAVTNKDKADAFTGRNPRNVNKNCGASGSEYCGLERVEGARVNINPTDRQKENGWYEDMESGYHINVKPVAALDKVVYAANRYTGGLPSGSMIGVDPCTSATFDGRVFAREVNTAETFLSANKHYESVSGGISDVRIVRRRGPMGPSGPGPDELSVAVSGMTPGSAISMPDMKAVSISGNMGITGVPDRIYIRHIE